VYGKVIIRNMWVSKLYVEMSDVMDKILDFGATGEEEEEGEEVSVLGESHVFIILYKSYDQITLFRPKDIIALPSWQIGSLINIHFVFRTFCRPAVR